MRTDIYSSYWTYTPPKPLNYTFSKLNRAGIFLFSNISYLSFIPYETFLRLIYSYGVALRVAAKVSNIETIHAFHIIYIYLHSVTVAPRYVTNDDSFHETSKSVEKTVFIFLLGISLRNAQIFSSRLIIQLYLKKRRNINGWRLDRKWSGSRPNDN